MNIPSFIIGSGSLFFEEEALLFTTISFPQPMLYRI